jgi:mannitol-1-/sugar-/sorbitol-6-phosphatase
VIQINCSALLFDMDGVLIDSTPAVARVWRCWASEHGLNPEEVVRKAHGRPSISTIREYLPHADHELENREVERREMEDLEGVVALPGSIALVASIPYDRWTIVTSSTRPLAEVRLRAAGFKIPQQLITSSDIVNGKPHPEPYLKAASVLGFPAGACVVVEDVPAGIRSGKSAGARVIAYRTTSEDAELLNAGADWIVDNSGNISASMGDANLTLTLNPCRQPDKCPGNYDQMSEGGTGS